MDAVSQFLKKNEAEAIEWTEILEYMLNDYDAYGYAEHTLSCIYNNVLTKNSITKNQIQAIKNIKDKPSNHGKFRR